MFVYIFNVIIFLVAIIIAFLGGLYLGYFIGKLKNIHNSEIELPGLSKKRKPKSYSRSDSIEAKLEQSKNK